MSDLNLIQAYEKAREESGMNSEFFATSVANNQNAVTNEDSARNLFADISTNNYERVAEAILFGVDINMVDMTNDTPLLIASKTLNDSNIISMLLDAGAKINAVDMTHNNALMNCIEQKNTEAAMLLIESGVDLTAVNLYGKTASNLALEQDLFDIFDTIEDILSKKV